MKLDLKQVLKNDDGETLQKEVVENEKIVKRGDLDLQSALHLAVNSTYRGEDNSPEEIYIRGKLARKIKRNSSVHFTSAEIQLMLSCVVKRYANSPSFVLLISEILDPVKFKEEETRIVEES